MSVMSMTAMIEQLNQVTTVKAANVVPVLKCMLAKQIVRASARNVLRATNATKKCLLAIAEEKAVIGDECFGMRIEFWAFDERFARLLNGSKIEISAMSARRGRPGGVRSPFKMDPQYSLMITPTEVKRNRTPKP